MNDNSIDVREIADDVDLPVGNVVWFHTTLYHYCSEYVDGPAYLPPEDDGVVV